MNSGKTCHGSNFGVTDKQGYGRSRPIFIRILLRLRLPQKSTGDSGFDSDSAVRALAHKNKHSEDTVFSVKTELIKSNIILICIVKVMFSLINIINNKSSAATSYRYKCTLQQ